MTICNMSIEAGAKAGMIAPDDTTYEFLANRPFAPKGRAWDEALKYWRSLPSDAEAKFAKEVEIDAARVAPMVTWGTNPEQALPITEVAFCGTCEGFRVLSPSPHRSHDRSRRTRFRAAPSSQHARGVTLFEAAGRT
jgi:homoaconitase/3-isopropylmalate dehydratase large subunit